MKERGFVTMATGGIRYFEVAHNLLLSYRFFSRTPLPFAIICDRTNEYTADFDKVILIDDPAHSFLDKLRVPSLAPYEETIFIDSDCLAYRDLNGLWKLFSRCNDFSYLGYAYPFHQQLGWFRKEDTSVFSEKVGFSVIYQGGLFFMRKGKLEDFSRTCRYILDHYDAFSFSGYPYDVPVDEPIFALASSVHAYKPARGYKEVFCYYPLCRSVRADIRKGKLNYRYNDTWIMPKGRYFLHWSMTETDGSFYKEETGRLADMIACGKRAGLFQELKGVLLDTIASVAFSLRSFAKRCLPQKLRIRLARFLSA